MRSTFRILMYLKKGSEKPNGLVPLMCRLTVDGEFKQFSCKMDVPPRLWDVSTGRASGKSIEAQRINVCVDKIGVEVNRHYQQMMQTDGYVTAAKLKDAYLGIGIKQETLLKLFEQHNDEFLKKVEHSRSAGTYARYRTVCKHIREFLMGYAVLHMEKASVSDSGMSAHIERTIASKNADAERTYLNREMITFPDGVQNRTQAIQHRIDTARLQRKIGKNQVRAIRILLTGSPDDMKRIEQAGKLDEWFEDNLDWLKKTYGTDNIVSAVLHLDETTPHIHATMIPIVTGERRKKKSEEQATSEKKKRYRKKDTSANRLCANDVMSQVKLKEYQNNYAEQMAKYGLQQGIEGSEAKHVTTAQYYRDLLNQMESIQSNISALLKQQEATKAKLSKVQADVSKEKLKNSAADRGSKLMDGVSSLLGTLKMNKIEMENKELRGALQNPYDENKQIRQRVEVV